MSWRRTIWRNSITLFAIVMGITITIFFMSRVGSLPRAITQAPNVSIGSAMHSMMFLIEYPPQDQTIERLSISLYGEAGRILSVPSHNPSYGDNIRIPPDLWQALKTLQHNWCTEPPEGLQPRDAAHIYTIVVNCERTSSPIYRLSVEQLPVAIREVMAVTPPPKPAP